MTRKRIVPCDVSIKRLYRMYVEVDEGAGEEEVKARAVEMLTDGRDPDGELTIDPDYEMEPQDICWVNPDFDGSWSDETEEDLLEIVAQTLRNACGERARLYTEFDFRFDGLIPTVIYIEYSDGAQITAGIWQFDHYELENGMTLDSPWDEIARRPGSYNSWWRIWDRMPTEEERTAAAWKGAENGRAECGA